MKISSYGERRILVKLNRRVPHKEHRMTIQVYTEHTIRLYNQASLFLFGLVVNFSFLALTSDPFCFDL